MKSVNLLPPEYIHSRRQAARVRKGAFAAAGIGLVIVMILGVQRIQLSRLRFEQERIRQATTSHDQLRSTIEAETEKKRALEARASIILSALDAPHWGRILYEISVVTPEGIWLDALAYQPEAAKVIQEATDGGRPVRDYGEIRFQGGAIDPSSVSRFMETLSGSSRFRSVTPVVAETSGSGRGTNFTIVGRLIY